jgi:hypothetical protein
MNPKRRCEILSAGMDAAREQLEEHPARPDYPHNYLRLYEWLEDKLFNLYEAICRKDFRHIRKTAGEIIVTASEMVEYTDMRLESPKRPEEKR